MKFGRCLRFIACLIACFSMSASTLAIEELPAGLTYIKYTTPAAQIIHVLKIDPNRITIKSSHANGKVLGLETIISLARSQGAVAAINGGFFHMGGGKDGLPAGILKIKQQWYSIAYSNHGAIGWSENTHTIVFDRVQTKTRLDIHSNPYTVNAVNQPGQSKKATVYTPAYGATTDSVLGGTDIIIEHNKVREIIPSGKTTIPKNGYVYSIGPKVEQAACPIEQGAIVNFKIDVIPTFKKENTAAWQQVDYIIGGIPLLIADGKIRLDYTTETISSSFIHQPHARTAIGLLNDGTLLCAVAEKSESTGSPGMTIPELSTFLKKLGCQYALNLDGGMSSNLFIKDTIVNHSEREFNEAKNLPPISMPVIRHIANAIMLIPNKPLPLTESTYP
jgi:uncharacterized protein YigE (DUF2233 family)